MAKWDGRNFRLDGKAVFIAGAGGVGSAIARGVSEAEAKVFLADLDLAAAEKVARTLQKRKRPCRAYKMDILNPAQILIGTRFLVFGVYWKGNCAARDFSTRSWVCFRAFSAGIWGIFGVEVERGCFQRFGKARQDTLGVRIPVLPARFP